MRILNEFVFMLLLFLAGCLAFKYLSDRRPHQDTPENEEKGMNRENKEALAKHLASWDAWYKNWDGKGGSPCPPLVERVSIIKTWLAMRGIEDSDSNYSPEERREWEEWRDSRRTGDGEPIEFTEARKAE